jgi:hypothetical protein
VNTLDRIAIEKAGYDNGWELSTPENDCLALSSSRFPGIINVDYNPAGKEWTLSFSENINIDELKRGLPKEIFQYNSALCWSVDLLYAVLRRASELAFSLPDSPEKDYQKRLEQYFRDNPGLKNTEGEAAVKIRIGQDVYRNALVSYWKGSCAVTGIAVEKVLRASHAKPWKDCQTSAERLCVYNGFLLQANLDALFDSGLVSFNNSGNILVSGKISKPQLSLMRITEKSCLRWIDKNHLPFLEWHRQYVFDK